MLQSASHNFARLCSLRQRAGLSLALGIAVTSWPFPADGAEPRLSLLPRDAHGWMQVRGDDAGTNRLLTLDASANLSDWKTIAVLHGESFNFFDPASANLQQRFYRFTAAPLTGTNDWKNQVSAIYDEFPYYGGSVSRWVKFAIPTSDPTRVFYADANRYRFHHDFVTARLEPYLGITLAELERISMFNTNRELVLGTVLMFSREEFGVQFVSRDALPRELTRDLFDLVRSTVETEPGGRAYYLPTFEQSAAAQAERDYFASNGISVASIEQWLGGDQGYSAGWAVGTLKFFAASNVAAAYADGRLRPDDILLIDGVPAELPYVSGIVTLTPTTANAHVAILAQSYGVPFGYMAQAEDRARALTLTNRMVALQVGSANSSGRVFLVPIDPPLESASLAQLAALKARPAFQFAPKERFGAYSAATDNLVPADIKFFGGKAANYGLLRRVIPSNSLPAIAVSFDLWDDFMAQTLGNGRTLRQEISNRLAGFTYPPNVGALQTNLAAIRSLIRTGTQFTSEQEAALTNALTVFDRRRNIRFRSSTNVEDAESFSGAGLYDSFSGCLADDQDGDTVGPSACDPTETDERGVFRAIRRVFASFYNDNATLERLRLGVDEDAAGMALLVHHSTPDEFELANGVATGRWQPQFHSQPLMFSGRMVTQLGAVSVANPDGSAVPEEVFFTQLLGRTPRVGLETSSSLVRLGDTVMEWDSDYLALHELLFRTAHAYSGLVTNRPGFQLDLEYKKVSPGVLEVKQVREIPATPSTDIAPFMLNAPAVFGNWHGFYDDLFMAHRFKSRWTLRHRNTFFDATNLAAGFYTELTIEHLSSTNVQTLHGAITNFPNYSRKVVPGVWNPAATLFDRWTMDTADGPADFTLLTDRYPYTTSQQPFQLLSDNIYYGLHLDVHFSRPVPYFFRGTSELVTNTQTRLYPLRAETSNDVHVAWSVDVPGQGTHVQVSSSYWMPAEVKGDDCRCPVLRIVESRIAGFTTEPLVLRGYWSQTMEDFHGSGARQFLFEPRLEPGLTAQQLAELAAADIAQIYVNAGQILYLIGFDGAARRWSEADFVPWP